MFLTKTFCYKKLSLSFFVISEDIWRLNSKGLFYMTSEVITFEEGKFVLDLVSPDFEMVRII